MEEIFGEDFSDHASSEMERLGKDFGNALQKYTMGQALTKKPGYRKPMFSGGPDTYTVAKDYRSTAIVTPSAPSLGSPPRQELT